MDYRRMDKKIAVGLVVLVMLSVLGIPGFLFAKKYLGSYIKSNEIAQSTKEVPKEAPKEVAVATPPATTPPQPEKVKQKITKDPPKHQTPEENTTPTATTSTNEDGSKTTVVSEGGIGSQELNDVIKSGPSGGSTPYEIKFDDETGKNAGLEKILKDYLNAPLKWGGEISSLYQITVRDAGDTKWDGQYAGSYATNTKGDIVSAYGYIVLNTHYHQSDPHFNDYMKLILSHEYGHHYTLYHKWVDSNLPNGARFPDEYYNIRPLSKATTATDYSLGWNNCEAEILAEDYSYSYSGYGYHAMADGYGYPSAGAKSWLDSLANGQPVVTSSPPAQTPVPTPVPAVVDNPPTVSLDTPANDAQVKGTVQVAASASDDHVISKVSFYLNSTLIEEKITAPYQISLDTTAFTDGNYTLKAVALDSANQSAESLINIKIQNIVLPDTEKPVVTIESPSPNPYSWTNAVENLTILVKSTDNVGVVTLKFYINDQYQGEVASGSANVRWLYSSVPAGAYIFKAEAYDAAGNIGESTLTINKS